MSPLTYPDWSEWSRSQAPEAWDQSMPLAEESYTNPRSYVNEPWYEGNEESAQKQAAQPPLQQPQFNGDSLPRHTSETQVREQTGWDGD